MQSLKFGSVVLLFTLLIPGPVVYAYQTVTENGRNLSNLSWIHRQFKLEKRIIGGAQAKENEYPWAVSLQLHEEKGFFSYFRTNYVAKCSGALYRDRWVITAAHCIQGAGKSNRRRTDPSVWRIRVGSEYKHAGIWEHVKGWFAAVHNHFYGHLKLKPYYRVTKVFLHPNFNETSPNLDHDVALMILEERIIYWKMPHFRPVLLPLYADLQGWPIPGEVCTAVGWGCHVHSGGDALELHSVKLPILTNKECATIFFQNNITSYKLCAGYTYSMKGICTGDSGGALVCTGRDGKETLAGIANLGDTTHPGHFPGVFTRVTNYTEWIRSMVRKYG